MHTKQTDIILKSTNISYIGLFGSLGYSGSLDCCWTTLTALGEPRAAWEGFYSKDGGFGASRLCTRVENLWLLDWNLGLMVGQVDCSSILWICGSEAAV